ncbi:hypothetical protein FBY24_1277 [Cellulomonas sp. SLBN-39]|nr:hypothetical protein FBY24_1277 [Cellulomonas sp. SLBN-39]
MMGGCPPRRSSLPDGSSSLPPRCRRCCVPAVLRRQEPVGPAQRVLGWEVVGADDWFDLHSWHCHGYADEVATALGTCTNSRGLLPSHAEASAVLRWMLTRPSAEAPAPVPWFPVALTASPAAERALAHGSRP